MAVGKRSAPSEIGTYVPSPRPDFDGPARIPYERATRHLWGDDESGRVADWIYVSSDKIHQLVFGLPPGEAFRHSDAYRTVFAADEVFYVLSGKLVLSNPESGEVHVLQTGEAAFFCRDTWHHGLNCDTASLRVLEFLAPPPSQGTSGAYARTRANLERPKAVQDELIGRWPMAQEQALRGFTMRVLRQPDLLWRLEGEDERVLVGILASTEQLTVGKVILLPGQRSSPQVHGGDESLYVLEGTLNVRVETEGAERLYELAPRDGFYVPEGIRHQYYNLSDARTELVFGVAPSYFPRATEVG
jgi:quercetin dioxygenase-like cupin family protein